MPPSEPRQGDLKYASFLLIFPVPPSFQLLSPRISNVLAGKRQEYISGGTFTPVATVYSNLLIREDYI